MLQVITPNGKVVKLPRAKLEEVVLELCGGGWSELSMRKALLNSDKLRTQGKVSIDGYKLELLEVSNDTNAS